MTFGESLQSLLATSGLKSRHLAMTLGYDVSYISRWTNDVKLPSIRNNDRLFQDIAAFFVSNSDPDTRAEMVQKLQLPCKDPLDDGALSHAILQLLQTSYIRQVDPKAHLNGAFQQNAVFLSGESIWGNAVFWESLSSLPTDASHVEIITTTPIYRSYRRNDMFFQNLVDAALRPVRIWQFLCLEDIQAHPNESFRSLLYLLSAPHQVEYQFYELKAPQESSSIFLIRDSLLQTQTVSPFSEDDFFVITRDPAIIHRYWTIAFRLVDNQKPLILPDPDWKQMKGQFGVNFLMQRNLRCILKFISADIFFENVPLADQPAPGGSSDWPHRVISAFDTIILYKETIIEYTMGTHHCGELSKQQREKTLRFLMEQARSGSRKLLILDAANSCCSYDDLCASVCIGSHHAYVLACSPEHQNLAYTISNRSLVSAMNLWFDNLEALPQDQCLSGEDAADYIARCMRLL